MNFRYKMLSVLLAASMMISGSFAVTAEELSDGKLSDGQGEVVQETAGEDLYEPMQDLLDALSEELLTSDETVMEEEGDPSQEEDLLTSEYRITRPDEGQRTIMRTRDTEDGPLDGDITDLITIFYQRTSGKVSRVLIETILTENGEEETLQSVCWTAADGSWCYVDGEGKLEPISPAGAYNLLSSWNWNIGPISDTASGGIGGYTVTIGEDDGIWNYYFTAEDVNNGVYKTELPGYFADLPAAFYIGVEGKQEGRGGLTPVGKKWYYLESDGSVVINGSRVVDDVEYFFGSDGTCDNPPVVVGWTEMAGGWYWMQEDGTILTTQGMTVLEDNTYYLGEGGVRTTGFVKIGKLRYYFDPDTGIMHIGWLTIGKNKYYFNKKGEQFFGFHNIGSKKYYFRGDGTLMTNKESYYINGQYYSMDANGVVTEQERVIGLAISRLNKNGRNRWAAFQYCSKLKYVSRAALSGTEEEKLKAYALYGFETGKGNNIVMAACYYYMAKVLGMDVHYVTGSVPLASGKKLSHAWVEVVIDGQTKVIDPYCYFINKKGAFLFEYGASGTWKYEDINRVN